MLKISLVSSLKNLNDLEEILLECGALSVTLQNAAESPVLEPNRCPNTLWPETKVSALFDAKVDIEQIRAKLSMTVQTNTPIEISVLQDQDWVRMWMEKYQPMRFGQRLWICPSWKRFSRPDAIVVILDPGLAFGTGSHPTTALCLEWLASHCLDDFQVIDYGCGSGILAIAAIKLGAQFAWAVDIDPQAQKVTRDNARKNNIHTNRISTKTPESLPLVKADLVVANILSGPLMELSRILADIAKPGGRIILSGILIDQARAVANKYADFFAMGSPKTKEGWVLLEGERIAK